MAGMVTSSLGRFCAGALGLTGIAAAEPLLLTAGAATGLTLGGPAALGILGIIAAFAGGSAVLRGSRARRRDQKVDEAQGWLEQLIKQNGSLTKALAGLPEDAPVGFGGSCERLRRVAAVFADTDPEGIAGRLAADAEFAAFIRDEMDRRLENDAAFRNGLDCLIRMMLDANQLGERQVGALNALNAKVDAIIATQGEHTKDHAEQKEALARIEGNQSKQLTPLDLDRLKQEMLAELRAVQPSTSARVDDPGTEHSLIAAVERLARDAERGGVTAGRILRSENPGDVMGYLAAERKRLDDARSAIDERLDEESIALDRELAAVAYVTGRMDEAEQALGRILALRPDDPDAINRIGHVHLSRGALPKATRAYRRLLKLAGAKEKWQAFAIGNLGNVLHRRGKLDKAEAMYREALAISERIVLPEGIVKSYIGLGNVQYDHGDLDVAETMYRESLAISERFGRAEWMAESYNGLGNVLCTRSDLDGAEAMYRKAVAIYKQIGRPEGLARSYNNLGILAEERGDVPTARAMWEQARGLYGEIGARHMVGEVQRLLDELPE